MVEKLYRALAGAVQARRNCIESGNAEWKERHEARIVALVKHHLPSGGGFDNGTRIDLDASTAEKLVFHTSFHHMDEYGSYDGWTEHTVTVRASLLSQVDIRISGRNRNEIKDLIHDGFFWPLIADLSDAEQHPGRALTAADIPADYPVRPLGENEAPKGRTTCGTCRLSWDDSISTSLTPTPSGRCPFEYFHKSGGES